MQGWPQTTAKEAVRGQLALHAGLTPGTGPQALTCHRPPVLCQGIHLLQRLPLVLTERGRQQLIPGSVPMLHGCRGSGVVDEGEKGTGPSDNVISENLAA